MLINSGVSEKEIKQPRTFCQLERVLALVGEKRAHVDGEVLLVGQRRQEGEGQPIVVGFLVEILRQTVVAPSLI